MTLHMPAETAAQDRIWMAFPSSGYALGETEAEAEAEAARSTWAAVARATSEFTPVTVVVTEAQTEHAKRHLGEGVRHPITVVNADLDDAWMRDIGPSFVVDETGGLHAVDWVFNGWGAQEWAKWDHDEHIGRFVADLAGTPVVSSQLRNEGGGIHVDGKGTVLATRSVQLDPGRNPGMSEAEVEAEFARTIGAQKVIWLDHGLHRDNQTYGTRGHVDIVAAMPSPGVVLVHDQRNPDHPDFEFSCRLKEQFAAETTADGTPFDVVPLPAPRCCATTKASSTTPMSIISSPTAGSSHAPSMTRWTPRRPPCSSACIRAGRSSGSMRASSTPVAAGSTASPSSSRAWVERSSRAWAERGSLRTA